MEDFNIYWEIGAVMGIIGYILLGALIVSGDIARLLDKKFGLDRLIKFQIKLSLYAYFITLTHPVFFMLAKKDVLTYIIPINAPHYRVAGIFAFYMFTAIMICSHVYKKISHSTWQYLHILTYVLFALATYHAVIVGSSTEQIYPMYIVLCGSIIISSIYRGYKKYIELRRGRVTIKQIVEETPDSYSVYFDKPAWLKFIAGEFVFLRLSGFRLHARHPFTIASAPGDPYVRLIIKNTGRFTNVLKVLVPGSRINMDGPYGIFTPNDDENLALICGGVGITPALSIIKDRLDRKINPNKTILIYGSKDSKRIIAKTDLANFSLQGISVNIILSEEDALGYSRGYVDRQCVIDNVPDILNRKYYICGPEVMKNKVVQTLKSLGVKGKDINCEDFFW